MDELTPAALAAVLDEPQMDLLAEALTIKANASSSSYAPRCPRTLRCSSSPSTVSPVDGSSQNHTFSLTAYDFRCTLMSSFFDDTKGVMMLAAKLLELANLVGLSQSDIARHFGITRSQVNLWAKNKRLVPKRYRAALVTLVTEEMQRCIALADREPGVLGEAYWNAMGIPPPPPRLRERLLTAIDMLREDWLAENRERHGLGPTASIGGVLEALEVYKTMTPAEMRKSANAQRLQVLSDFLQECATVLNRIGPMQDIVEEKKNDVDNDHSPSHARQPGYAD